MSSETEKIPQSAHEWLQDALGRYQITHVHSSIREALKAMDETASTPSPAEQAPLSPRVGGHSSWVAQSKEAEQAGPEGFEEWYAPLVDPAYAGTFEAFAAKKLAIAAWNAALARPGLSGVPESVSSKVAAAKKMIEALNMPRRQRGSREWILSIPADEKHDPDIVIFGAINALERLLASALADADRLKGEVVGLRADAMKRAALSGVLQFRAETAEAELSRLRGEVKEAGAIITDIVGERDSELDMMTCTYSRGSDEHRAWHDGVSEMWKRLEVIKRPAKEWLARNSERTPIQAVLTAKLEGEAKQ